MIYGQEGEGLWYMYCTTDPLTSQDRTAEGGFNFRPVPQFTSKDLINWTYVGDAFERDPTTARPLPAWAEQSAGVWAPEIDYFNGKYYLYYGITDVKPDISGAPNCNGDNAIGVATSDSPTGPWQDSGQPLIAPRYNGDPTRPFGDRECNFFWTYDPEVIQAQDGQKYIYYGSYYGGIFAQMLSPDALRTVGDPVQVTIANRYEGAEVVYRNGFYYLFVSATNCCNGPLTAYSVFVGRSASPTGPFVDQQGVSLLAARVGGTPVLSLNGNRWVGGGHNTVFQDFGGQWWTIYHAVDRNDPYLEGAVGFTKRPALLDPLDWVNGWPTVRGGAWASDSPQPAPAAQPGQKSSYQPRLVQNDRPGGLLFAEEFDDGTLDGTRESEWTWMREDAANYGFENGTLRFDTQAADLFVDNNTASVLTLQAPNGGYVVETRVKLNVPPEGCCYNFTQAGLVIYGDDDNYIKLTHVSIWETRQTEFAKELAPVPAGYPRYGNTVIGPPSDWTYLRIAKITRDGTDYYTGYTSTDGQTWVRGGTWTHTLGMQQRIGLVSMGGAGFTAEFDYVRVYNLRR